MRALNAMSMNLEDTTGEIAATGAAVEAAGPLALETRFLATLLKMVAYRASTETEIEARHVLGKQQLEEARQAAREAIRDLASHREVQAIGTDYEEACRQAKERCKTLSAKLDREFAKVGKQVDDQFIPGATSRVQSKSRMKPTCKPRSGLGRRQEDCPPAVRGVRAAGGKRRRTRVRSDRDQAQKLLEKWRQRPPVAKEVPATPPVKGSDLAARLQECVSIVATQLAELQQLHTPRWARSKALSLFFLLVAAGAPAATWYLKLGDEIIVGASLAVAVVFGAGTQPDDPQSGFRPPASNELYPPLGARLTKPRG